MTSENIENIENTKVSDVEITTISESQIKLFHPGLKDLLTLEKYCNCQIGFLSIENPLPDWYKELTKIMPSYSLGLHLRREYRHLAMGIKSLQAKESDTFFVFEAYNQHLLLLLPLLLLTRKNILIMLHGNQQFAIQNKIKYWGLLYLKLFLILFKKFKVVLLEVDDNLFPKKVRLPDRSKVIIPHPIIQSLTPRLSKGERLAANQKIKIGIVGIIRQDKPIGKLIEQIHHYLNNKTEIEFIIGTPIRKQPAYLNELKITVWDTTKEQDYFATLQAIDILVTHYDRDRYYYRTSGVISDAGSAGCYILASDYPLIEHQINYHLYITDNGKIT